MMLIPTTVIGQAEQRSGGAWNQLYPEAGRDFPTHEDFKRFVEDTQKWMDTVNQQLKQLSEVVATHTHNVLPHTHPGPVGPAAAVTAQPIQSSMITWKGKQWVLPQFYNTTNLEPNLMGTSGYKYRQITVIPPFIPGYASPISLTSGL